MFHVWIGEMEPMDTMPSKVTQYNSSAFYWIFRAWRVDSLVLWNFYTNLFWRIASPRSSSRKGRANVQRFRSQNIPSLWEGVCEGGGTERTEQNYSPDITHRVCCLILLQGQPEAIFGTRTSGPSCGRSSRCRRWAPRNCRFHSTCAKTNKKHNWQQRELSGLTYFVRVIFSASPQQMEKYNGEISHL